MTENHSETDDVIKAESYHDYLALDAILDSQELYSGKNKDPIHDEILFIVLHQSIELWFLQALAEVDEARRLIRENAFGQACEELERIVRIFTVLTSTWDVMATLRPFEFWRFRRYFGEASGFQSAQFRQFEFALGLRRGAGGYTKYQPEDSRARQRLDDELNRPSLWDEVNLALRRLGAEIPDEVASSSKDWRKPYPYPRRKAGARIAVVKADDADDEGEADIAGESAYDSTLYDLGCKEVEDVWFFIHRHRREHADLYRLGERLLDVSAAFGSWRAKHVSTVERFIGNLAGTGKKGVKYLRRTLPKRPFPELWSVRDRFDKLLSKDAEPQITLSYPPDPPSGD